jgi:Holliday junction resolvase RusA-like endonuclease
MSSITFQVNGDPKAQPRPRAFARNMGGGKFVARVFEAGTAEGWKSLIAIAAKVHRPASPLFGAVLVNATFCFRRPKSHFRTGKNAHDLRPDAPMWHTGKPDRDNLEKALLDALTQVGGFWSDDCQVCDGTVRKMYSAQPGVFVEIKSLEATAA